MTKKKQILVVDDDESIVDCLQIVLESEGYRVETTIHGENVVELVANHPDLLLLDLRMPGINGEDICRKLKAQPTTKYLPIIILSANNNTEEIAKKAGADDFLGKPFDMYALLSKVKTQLHIAHH